MASKFYDKDGKEVYDGDVVYATDLNTINSSVDTAFQSVEADLETIEDDLITQVDLAEGHANDSLAYSLESATSATESATSATESEAQADRAQAYADSTATLHEDFTTVVGETVVEILTFTIDGSEPRNHAVYVEGLYLMNSFPCDAGGVAVSGFTNYVNLGETFASGLEGRILNHSTEVISDVTALVAEAEASKTEAEVQADRAEDQVALAALEADRAEAEADRASTIADLSPQWVTKTTDYTASQGDAILVDTTLGIVNVTLPESPIENVSVKIADYAKTFGDNMMVVKRATSGELLQGVAEDMEVGLMGISFELSYKVGTEGWVIV